MTRRPDGVDFVVVGTGIAGLTFALSVADHGRVLIVTKKGHAESATNLAQGGIAAVMSGTDSFDRHIADTLAAGDGLCRRDAVEIAVRSGPDAIGRLTTWGARFSTVDEPARGAVLSLGREGGHSERRIVHAADMTGREVERALVDAALRHPNIEILEDHVAIDLAVARDAAGAVATGIHVLDVASGKIETVPSAIVILATGGCGKVYLYTTNPDIATGDGVAIAFRAGVPVRNMEFIQFHPTCLYHHEVRSFLISEAVRGEGAVLVDLEGRRIMTGVHPKGDLAPRDVVARAIDRTMKRTGDKHVFLDATPIGRERIKARFPNIDARLLELGIDMASDPIPVVPAAHYLCGGVAVDLECRTPVRGLYAVGEVAHTGMHGANRLASNSLLEAVVFSERAAERALSELPERRASVGASPPAGWAGNPPGPIPEGVLVDYNWDVVRRSMWDYVGIVRTERRLLLGRSRVSATAAEVSDCFARYPVGRDLLELRNITLVGELIIRSALWRKESRGLHYMEDHPERDDERFRRDTVIEGSRE